MKQSNIVLIAGGTGGHVIPAVILGNYLIMNGYNCYLLTDNRGKKYVYDFQGKVVVISASHLNHNFFGKLKSLCFLLFGLMQATLFFINIRPFKCLSFGSYASFMPLIILSLFKFIGSTHLYLHEQNSVMGKVNIFFSPVVNKIFLNFKETNKLKEIYKKKSYFVGLPNNHIYNYRLRKIDIEKNKIIRIFVCGGSQGAVNLNYKIKNLLLKINRDCLKKIEVSMQCPISQIDEFKEIFKVSKVKYDLKFFFHNILDKLYQTDILIARAGAGTINDTIMAQIPTIFIPLPQASNNHQFYNAQYLQNKKAALIINEKELENNYSYLVVKNLIENSDQQISMIKNLQKIKNFDTSSLIFKEMNLI